YILNNRIKKEMLKRIVESKELEIAVNKLIDAKVNKLIDTKVNKLIDTKVNKLIDEKMNTVTLTDNAGMVTVEGQRKDVVRVAMKLDRYLQERAENENQQ
ncbi:MAG: hypothetical protein J6W86_07550, partial [Bacteroidales bacterium]|nr:hypothetical protein [Bacteroidales bacterium]